MITTVSGERFIRRAQAVLHEPSLARDEAGQFQGSLRGRISACLGVLPHMVLLHYLPDVASHRKFVASSVLPTPL